MVGALLCAVQSNREPRSQRRPRSVRKSSKVVVRRLLLGKAGAREGVLRAIRLDGGAAGAPGRGSVRRAKTGNSQLERMGGKQVGMLSN
jgi:hypothetical protein